MNMRVRSCQLPGTHFLFVLVLLLFLLSPALVVGAAGQADEKIRGLLHNEDCTDFFAHRPIPPGRTAETLNRYLDVIANAGVDALFCNINARRTNFRSEAWAAFWDGYDPERGDDQPYFASIPPDARKRWRMLVHNMWQAHDEGVDYPAHVIERCRERKIAPWLSLRMNDVHFNDNLKHPFHGEIWRRPELFRRNHPGYFARALDYAHPDVRDHFRKLIVELLDRYDPDGVELDFMREPYLFSAGEEKAGAKQLTQWLGEIRRMVDAAAVRRGHPIRLGVRVPSHPQTALGLGLNVPAWSKAGLVDLVVACPRWQTLHFDIPLRQWRELLGDKVSLAGGLETRYQPAPSVGFVRAVSPEHAAGAAVAVWSAGADALYLFNHFQNSHPGWAPDVYRRTLQAFGSASELSRLPRLHAVTLRDVVVPGERYRPPLPASGARIALALPLGPRPPDNWSGEVIIAAGNDRPSVRINGVPAQWREASEGLQIYALSSQAVSGDGDDKIEIIGPDGREIRVNRVEVRLAPPEKGKAAR